MRIRTKAQPQRNSVSVLDKRDIYIVSVVRVPGVSRTRMLHYIKEAVTTWCGQFEPVHGGYPDSLPYSGDPLGPPCTLMNRGAVKVWAEPRKRKVGL